VPKMSDEVPQQVSAFAHVIAGYSSRPVVRVLSGMPGPACDSEDAEVLLCTKLLDQIQDVDAFLEGVQHELGSRSLGILCARDRERNSRSLESPTLQWTPEELIDRLARSKIPVLFMGHTAATETDSSRSMLVTVLAGRGMPRVTPPPANFKVVAIMSSFNEADIIGPSLDYLLEQGIHVHLLDNWSTDGTYDIAAAKEGRGVRIERFPREGRSDHYVIGAILERKERLAKELEADWFIHADVDEIREGPFPGGNIREALHHAGQAGFNCVESTLLEFSPVDDSFPVGGDLRSHFRFWRPGTHPAHFVQRKIWRKTSADVNLMHSAGHDVSFLDRKIYPFHFLLRHYPFRSTKQIARKLLDDRKVDPDERAKGWGDHYDADRKGFSERGLHLRRREELRLFSPSFYDDYLIERLSAVGFRVLPDAGQTN
jgi:glycosyltransferase involved in cell wall biosynthesis